MNLFWIYFKGLWKNKKIITLYLIKLHTITHHTITHHTITHHIITHHTITQYKSHNNTITHIILMKRLD